jgi:hypothetical protein
VTAARRIPALLALAAGAPVLAQGDWLLIGRDLTERRVEITQLEAGTLLFVDEAGRSGKAAVADLLALINARPPAERPARELPWITRQLEVFGEPTATAAPDAAPFVGELELADGQRWVGTLVSSRAESLSWLVEDSLVLDASLDSLRAAAINAPIGDARASWGAVDDRLILTNGDIVDGFVASIGPTVRIETPAGDTETPIDRVAGLLLANPATDPTGAIVHTQRGSIIAVTSLAITATGHCSAEVNGESLVGGLGIRTSELRAVDLAPGDYIGLASLPPHAVTAPGGTSPTAPRTVTDPTLGVDSLELQGPVRVDWVLPRPAARFAATAALPPAMWAWGDCEVVVRTADGREVQRERLSADHPEAALRVPLGGQTGFSIEIEQGRAGAVQDRIVLERPLVTWR